MDNIALLILGIFISVIGIVNMTGNISTIHSYNRRKVKEEDVPKYGRAVGTGTLIIGVSLIAACIHAPFCCLRVWDTSQQAIFDRCAAAREVENTEVGTRFLCLLFFCLLSSTVKMRKCQNLTQKRKNTAICGVPNGCISRKNGGFYSPAVSFLTSCIAFAVAVITVKSLLSMLSSNVSSCRRCVDLSVSLFGKKNWSTETSKSVTSS